jgi:succinate dehydrogenase/fumarate reductase flavoprotein subunit
MSCDVLIVGGGSAGAFAAITAAEQGAKVIVSEQAHITVAVTAGQGNDHIAAYLNLGGAWDTREEFLNWYIRLARA